MIYLTLIKIFAFIGIVLISYGIFLETEKKQDIVFMIGFLCLFFYALSIENLVFIIASGIFTLCSLVEFLEIMFGLHKQNKKYNLKTLIREK
ncbi:MAG: hypothetical protein WC414_03020 [Patescibacteria group bacterium]